MAHGERSHSLRGPTDRGALIDFRDVFVRLEPMAVGELEDFFDPTELRIHLDDGVGEATTARFDVNWTTTGDYSVHYTGSDGRNLRWDVHPHDYPSPLGEAHFHPPSAASNDPDDVEESCIEVSEVVLVSRAVHSLWRDAYTRETVEGIDEASNPP